MGVAQTSSRILKKGTAFPPTNEKPRRDGYKKNFSRYRGDYNKNKRLEVRTQKGKKVYDMDIITINSFQLDTNKFIGLLLNDYPMISTKDEDYNKILNDMIHNKNVWLTFEEVAKSFSTLGDGVFQIYEDNDGANIAYVNPNYWIPVVDHENIARVKYHILWYPLTTELPNGAERVSHVKVICHFRGCYSEIVYTYDNEVIGDSVEFAGVPEGGQTFETGLSDFAIQTVHNRRALDEVYGNSDYSPYARLNEEFEKGLTLATIHRDKHGEPILLLPFNTLMPDHITGKVAMNGHGGVIEDSKPDSKRPEYLESPFNMDATQKLLETIQSLIVTQTEYGEVFWHGKYADASGESLKTQLKGALDKVKRQIGSLEFVLKKVLTLMLELEGVSLRPSDITVEWQDGITASLKEMSESIKMRMESQSMTLKRILMKFDGLTSEQADEEILNKIAENKLLTPPTPAPAPAPPQ